MFTLDDAQKNGWTLDVDGEDGTAFRGDTATRAALHKAYADAVEAFEAFAADTEALRSPGAHERLKELDAAVGAAIRDVGALTELHVASATPLFSLLVNIAEREGVGFVIGYGGGEEITADLVAACSGEQLAPPAPPTREEIAAKRATDQRVELVAKLAAGQASDNEVQKALAQLLGATT